LGAYLPGNGKNNQKESYKKEGFKKLLTLYCGATPTWPNYLKADSLQITKKGYICTLLMEKTKKN
jgi:hypothetical protein